MIIRPILLVEDDEDDVFFITEALEKCGITNPIQTAGDGQQAVEYLRGAGKFADRILFPPPCFVLLDLKLPYLRGLDVLKWMRHEARLSIPVVIFTSSESETDIETAFNLGANAYLVKPTEVAVRLEIARAIRDFWFTHNHMPSCNPGFIRSAGDLSRKD